MSANQHTAGQENWWARLTRSKYFVYVLISPLFLVLLAYVIYPFYQTFLQSVVGTEGSTLKNYQHFFSLTSTANLEALWTSVYISVISVITCAIVGVTMAFLIERYEFPGRKLLSVLILVPMAVADGKTFNTTVQEIKYDHINDSYFMYPSNINGVAFELLKPENLKVGYIDSGFDTIADSLLNAGFDIKKLTPEDLATGDLSQYDTIVAGIRSTLGRPDVLHNNARLLEYVENGGHLVMQYVTSGDPWNNNKFTPPYSLTIGSPSIRVRVTDEHAKVTVTQPEHELFNYPNKITDSDWDHWVQERALYFPSAWDDRYETFVSMADPGEEPFTSGILMAEYGEGTFLYTNLVFYRQINAQVPGGYRIFTNLISYGANN